MKLLSPSLEKLALRSICRKGDPSSVLLGVLNDEYFAHPSTLEGFQRVVSLVRDRGKTMSWRELTTDPGVSEETRKYLERIDQKPLRKKSSANKLAFALNKYRKARKAYFAAEYIVQTVKKDKIDVDEMLTRAADMITEARVSGQREQQLLHIGHNNNSIKTVKAILNGETNIYIPTGFKAFDNENVGLPVGGLTILGATTGGGKSTVGLQLVRNMAEWGARCCIVPLEMTDKETLTRRLANLSGISMSKFLKPQERLNELEKKKIIKRYKEYVSGLKRRKFVESYFAPEEDMTIEEILFTLKPYAYDVIFIDYIGLLKGVDGDDQWRQLSNAARFAKRWAAMNGVQVILAAQLSDEGIVRYSKAIKEHASNMWTWIYNDAARESHIITVEQQKARSQRQFPFQLFEDFETMTMRDLTEDELAALGQNGHNGGPDADDDDDEDFKRYKNKGKGKPNNGGDWKNKKKKQGYTKTVELDDYYSN